MTAHTPGPWGIDHNDEENECYILPPESSWPEYGGHTIALVPYTKPRGEWDHSNATLIAAAPDLLEALGSLLRLVDVKLPDDWKNYDGEVGHPITMARAAIAKAEGREP